MAQRSALAATSIRRTRNSKEGRREASAFRNHDFRHGLLGADLLKERELRALDRAELARTLQILSADAIRSRQADARRAKAALSILNQGWANMTTSLQRAVDGKLWGDPIHKLAQLIEQHATSRAVHAYSCEGLVPGVSELVADINYNARALQQVCINCIDDVEDAASEADVANSVLNKIRDLQRAIGDFQEKIAP